MSRLPQDTEETVMKNPKQMLCEGRLKTFWSVLLLILIVLIGGMTDVAALYVAIVKFIYGG